MMNIPRLLPLVVAVALLSAGSPALIAQQQNAQPQQPQQRTQQEQRDIQTLVQVVDAVSSGKQPAPTDIGVAWESSHFVRGGDGSTYIPFTLAVDAAQLAKPGSAVYIRVMTKQQVAAAVTPAAAPAAEQNNNNRGRNQQQAPPARIVYPWDNIYFVDIAGDGKLSRPMALRPGEYEVFIAVKEKSVGNAPSANAPAPKIGLLRRELVVPDFNAADLSTSSIIIANVIEPLAAPLTAQQQQENPYTFGAMRVVPSPDLKLKKASELQVLFWIYGSQQVAGKPDVLVEYNFHQKTAEGEKYFNKTAPQPLNAQTLPPQFDVTAGHQLPGSLVVPLMSFPVGEYRLEIKVTDKASGKTLTQNATFIVEA